MEEVRRNLIERYGEKCRARPEQRLCRRPVGAHLLRSRRCRRAAETRCATASPLRQRPRLARPRPQHRHRRRLARAARRRAARHRLSGLARGGRAVEGRRQRHYRLRRRQHRHCSPPRLASTPRRGTGGARSTRSGRAWSSRSKQQGADSYALRSIPEISGGMVVEEVRTGRVLAMQGGLDVRGSDLQPRHPGAAPARLDLQADRLFGRARQRHDPGLDHHRRPVLRQPGRGLGNKCFRNFAGGYAGPQTMRWGVEQSRNLMTVRTANQIGMDKVTAAPASWASATIALPRHRARRRRHHGARGWSTPSRSSPIRAGR